MEDPLFSDAFCRFLQIHVPSVFAAELLLQLAREPERWWELGELLSALPPAGVTPNDARRYVEGQPQLLQLAPGDRVRFGQPNPETSLFIRALDKAYNERPVTLIRVIYNLRDSRIQSFADAFRLRRN